jgi:hypothetical protein
LDAQKFYFKLHDPTIEKVKIQLTSHGKEIYAMAGIKKEDF